MWDASRAAGAAVHSNSWGYWLCGVDQETFFNDKYLYEVR